MLNIYHNNRCGKSRAILYYLKDQGHDPEVIEYLKQPLSEEKLKELLKKLNLPASEMIRTQEDIYRKEYKGLNLTEEEWIKVLLEYPRLMKRPIIETQLKAVWAASIDELEDIL